ncbi:phospholipase A1 [Moraxella macacae 0408225]|uniref:Phospholipase A1 n=1 Tax=Moraxella macacae 0408225 TaxID=1230338 RepID=L2F9M8_9GAMM|nr:phospholipase A [Moraxella macacae]ELA09779.1 phospholipase A1 [Moraxella macacae 0408225]
MSMANLVFVRTSLLTLSSLSLMMLSISAQSTTSEQSTTQTSQTTNQTDEATIQTQADKFFQCSQIGDSVLRLACYDKIAAGDATLVQKIPLDLSKTVSNSIHAGKVAPVLVNGKQVDLNRATVLKSITNQSLTNVSNNNQNPPNQTNAEIDPIATTESVQKANAHLDTMPDKDREILQAVGVNQDDVVSYTPLSQMFDLDRNDPAGLFTLRPYYQTYFLPIFAHKNPNETPHSPTQVIPDNYPDLQHIESKMQLSLKTKMLQDVFHTNADVWFGYTQQSYWQVYNDNVSRPFRVSDYQPEIFITQPVKADLPFDGDLRMIGAGLVHQSNGQSDPLSRSWNRAYLMGGMEWGKLTVVPRAWLIFPSLKPKPRRNNEDIGDYMGYGDIRWQYPLSNKDTIGGLVRFNPLTGKGAAQVEYARPIRGSMKAYVQLFHGYGENIQDYNHESTNIGVGLMFNDFSGL